MKIKAILFCIVATTSLSIHAQQLKIGLKLNPIIGFANVNDEDGNSVDNREQSIRPGWAYGLTANYLITENYGLYSGIHIVRKGYDETFRRDTLPTSDQSIGISSVEIPLAILLRSNEISNGLYVRGIFGVTFDVNIGYQNKYSGSNPFNTETGSGTIRDGKRIKNGGLSFIIGPGVDLETSLGNIALGITYHQGLSNVNPKNRNNNNLTIKPNYVALDIEYFF